MGLNLFWKQFREIFSIETYWADNGYSGQLIDWIKITYGWVLEIVKRSDDVKGFKVLSYKWVVERTFG
jgi:putative transposase